MIDYASDSCVNMVQKIFAETEFAFVVKIARSIKFALCLRVKRKTHFL